MAFSFISGDKMQIVYQLIKVAVVVAVTWVALWVNRRTFRRIRKVRDLLHFRFLERAIQVVIIVSAVILGFSVFGDIGSVWKTLLGGTTVISAVLVFAAQDVIKDFLGGFMISLYKPFEIGNRIELDNGESGIVKDITMRHVVLQGVDSQVFVIPNSKLNAMLIRNNSFESELRAIQFQFQIAYGSDVEKAQRVIRQVIVDSEYTVPGKTTPEGELIYGPVYFMAYEESSLHLTTTAYYREGTPTEVVRNDINLRVDQALKENGIEIPFAYLNVIQKQEKPEVKG